MSITDELRKWGRATLADTSLLVRMEAIADRIDAEHGRAMADAYLSGTPTDEKLTELGWIRLPKDADGEAWHIGDRTESGQTIEAMGLNKHGWHFVGTVNEIDPAIHRHYHAPTVEDVLTEFAAKLIERGELTNGAAQTIAEYAAKLQLKEDE